jgi:predicted nuclease with TOPRIM domain
MIFYQRIANENLKEIAKQKFAELLNEADHIEKDRDALEKRLKIVEKENKKLKAEVKKYRGEAKKHEIETSKLKQQEVVKNSQVLSKVMMLTSERESVLSEVGIDNAQKSRSKSLFASNHSLRDSARDTSMPSLDIVESSISVSEDNKHENEEDYVNDL